MLSLFLCISSLVNAQKLYIESFYKSGVGRKYKLTYELTNVFGKLVVKQQFDLIADFSEGLAKVELNGKYGYIDKTGNVVIQPQFDFANDFSEGLAAVRLKSGGKTGYIDKTGNFVIQPQFDWAESFSEGLAKVELNGKRGYIDKTGNFAIQPQFDFATSFSEGLAAVELNGKWGYIDKTGNFVIKPRYKSGSNSFAHPFSNGLARVKLNGKYGYIDKTGQFIVKPQFNNAYDFTDEGIAMVRFKGKLGYIDKTGQFIVKPQFYSLKEFSEGLAAVELKSEGKMGYIDKTGNFVIPLQFDYAYSFSDGLAKVRLNGKYGYIDKTGNFVIQPQFDLAESFSEGIAKVKLNITSGYIDKSGTFYLSRADVKSGESYTDYLNRVVPTWEQYVTGYDLAKPEATPTEIIKQTVEREVNIWQQKSEFESSSEWQQRVNEQTRAAKVKEITARFQADYNRQVENYNNKLAAIRSSYEQDYYKEASDRYCSAKAKEFAKQDFELKPYDADNETFLISSVSAGDILLPVPKDEASKFKSNWDNIKSKVKATFVPIGDDVALKSVTFGDYTYDGNTKASYAVTNIDYNFAPIEMSNLDLAISDYDFDQISSAPTVATISNPNAKTISATKVNPESRTLAVGSASDVDLNIPQSKVTAKNTFAIVIANESYKNVESVENAANDGKIVAQYLTTTLGIPQKQVFAYTNASYGEMVDALDKMQNIAKAYSGTDYNVIFYYAGHGVPDEQSHEAYLLPIDGKPGSSAVNISLSKLYSTLGNLGATTVYVMLDACFSGSLRGDGMLAQARGVAIKAKAAEPQGNMVVLSAAQGDETAYPYQGKSHGLFTYYLLKKLQESSGNVTIGELSDYVIENVRKTSVLENNGKLQTPTVRASLSSGDAWRNNKLVK
jgi:hypothetical protein